MRRRAALSPAPGLPVSLASMSYPGTTRSTYVKITNLSLLVQAT